nr:ABC transporter ATP-binding protein [Candidatus Methanofastidiosa archaeon]
MDVISVNNLTKFYVLRSLRKKKENRGIENVSFNVKRGEIFGFLGPNGAGKTTTMRLLLDLIRPTSGSATILGMDTRKDSLEIRGNVGYIPGEINFYNERTAGYMLSYYEGLQGSPSAIKDELVSIFDIPLDRPVKAFSKGMKQKLAIIQGFMHDPDIVIMDEPTAGLDPLVQQRFYDFLLNQKKKGKTIFISTHILSEAQRVCDRVAIIKDGNIVATEEVSKLAERSGRSITVSFDDDVSITDLENEEIVSIRSVNGGFRIQTGSSLSKTLSIIAKHKISDITITETSLEDIFL